MEDIKGELPDSFLHPHHPGQRPFQSMNVLFSSPPPYLPDLYPTPIPELRQRDAQCQLGCHIGQWIACGLTGKGRATREPGIHFDDIILQRERTEKQSLGYWPRSPTEERSQKGKKIKPFSK